MSADEFHEQRVEIPSWIRKTLKWISEILEEIFHWILEQIVKLIKALNLGGGDGSGVSLARIVAFVIISVLAAGLLTVIVLLVLKLLRRTNVRRKTEVSDAEELVRLSQTPDESMRLYREYLEKGDCREAYRYLFISLLIQLNTRELIRIKIFKTNRIYKREILDIGAFDEKMTEAFFELFNLTRFGGRSISEETLREKYNEYLKMLADADLAVKKRKKGGDSE